MTLLTQGRPTFPQGIEGCLACNPARKSGWATFSKATSARLPPGASFLLLGHLGVHQRLVHAEEGELSRGDELAALPGDVHRREHRGLAPVAHCGGGAHRALRLVAQEVQRAGLGHIIAPVRVGGYAGGVVRQGVNGAAVDHAVGVLALGPDGQPEHRVVLFHQLHLNVIVVHEAVLFLPAGDLLFQFVHTLLLFQVFRHPYYR